MLRNYVKTALRTLLRYKGYAAINVIGLAIGIACAVLILLWVADEWQHDRFHAGADHIYRVAFNGQAPNAPPDRFAGNSRAVAPELRENYPAVEHVTRIDPWSPTVTREGQFFRGDDFAHVDPAFFDVFTFPLVQGNPDTALDEPYTLVLTTSMAEKYFGEDDPMGQTLVLDDSLNYTVTGVAADPPAASHFTFDFLTSWATVEQLNPVRENEWLSINSYTYVKLRPDADADVLERQIAGLVEQHMGDVMEDVGLEAQLALQPLTDIYLRSDRRAEIGTTGDVRYVYVFSAIAAFILLIACINFMNLATARSMERAKEVGVRKTLGSTRGALVGQFLSESVLVAGVALMVALGLIGITLPLFNDLTGKAITFRTLLTPLAALGLLGLAVVVGLLAGSYPALALARFRPVEVLKGSFSSTGRGARLRQGLVIFQFAISVVLIVGTLVVIQQLDYMQNRALGFDKEQVLVLDGRGLPNETVESSYRTFKQEVQQLSAVEDVSASNQVPGRGTWVQIVRPEGLPDGESRRMQVVVVDHDYLETMGIDLVAGRDFDEAFETDTDEAILINEAAVKNAGWGTPETALGKHLRFGGDDAPEQTVVGVFEDYHHYGLQQRIEPMLLSIVPSAFNYFSLRVRTDDLSGTLAALEQTWNAFYPGHTFNSFFLDADFEQQYANEQRLSRLFGAFAGIAILIACLGLFGLASYITAQRTKEIGVRKVLGASVSSIVLLLAQDFVKLVAVAVLLAVPLAYLAMDQWLDDFAYRISMPLGAFALAGLVAVAIAILTVSYQSIRAALSDPVQSLRYE
jgi:putative ABC transport system permease protein